LKDNLLILAECTKIGKNFAFSEAYVYTEKDLSVIATGKQTKIFLNDKFDFIKWKKLLLFNLWKFYIF